MEGSQSSEADDHTNWARLTDKQRACLDLLLERKTSKQIARALDISKYTVDQRLRTAREILGAADRDDTAIRYARLRQICDRIAYHPVDVSAAPTLVPSDFPDGGQTMVLEMHDSIEALVAPSGGRPPSGKLWRPDHIVPMRIMIVAAMLAASAIFFLGSVGIAETLSRLVSR